MKKEIANIDENVSVELATMFAEETASGIEEATASDFGMPIVGLLQDISDEVKERSDKYVAGAKSGMFINKGSGELMGNQFDFIPCYYKKRYVEWTPRSAGGGLVGEHPFGEETIKFLGANKDGWKISTPAGNDLIETAYFYCLNAITAEPFIISLSKTGLKAARRLLSQVTHNKVQTPDGARAILHSQVYSAHSRLETSPSGDYFIWSFSHQCVVNADQFKLAKAFNAQVSAENASSDLPF